MTPRRLLVLVLALVGTAACSDSSEPSETVPREVYYIAADPAVWNRFQLYGVAVDGSSPVPLLGDSVLEKVYVFPESPPWVSLDGRTVKVLVYDYDTGSRALLNLDRLGEVQSMEPYAIDYQGYGAQPPLSPDGTRLAWFSGGYLNLSHPNGGNHTRTYFDSLGAYSGVAWSRDGKWLAYVMGLRDDYYSYIVRNEQVWIMRLSDGFKRPISGIGEGRSQPAWSRDGDWVTFLSSTGINRVRVDGSGSEQSVYIGAAGLQSWGPRDALIGFLRGGRLSVMHPDGSGAQDLVDDGGVTAFGWAD